MLEVIIVNIRIFNDKKYFKLTKKQNDTTDLFIATHSMTELDFSKINFYDPPLYDWILINLLPEIVS